MANVNVGDLMTWTLVGRVHGQRTMNTFHYRARIASSLPTQAAAAAAFDTFSKAAGGLEARLRGCTSQAFAIEERWFQIIKPARFEKIIITGSVAGNLDVAQTTQNIQASITRRGEMGNRKNVGGIRVVLGTSDDVVQNGIIEPGQVANLELLAQSMEQTVVTAGAVVTWDPLVSMPANTADYVNISQCFVQTTVRVIRRRTVGLGI